MILLCNECRRPWAALLLPSLLALTAQAVEFRGRLDPAPDVGHRVFVPLKPAAPELFALFPAAPAAREKVWQLSRPLEIKGMAFAFAVVSDPAGVCALWLDRDRDGRFSANEKWDLPGGDGEVRFTLPWDNGIYQEFPIFFKLGRLTAKGTNPDPEAVLYSFNVVYGAGVEIDGRTLRLTFATRPAESAINLGSARISMDANFNGRIESQLGETENPSGKSPVFRVRDHYLAVKSVDMATGEVVLEERPAADYTRFAALPGQEMPDFAFTTLDGQAHKLSDFRGKYVLLDFWGTWCGPCIGEMQQLQPVYEQYHARGFEIIGMNMEKTNGSQTPEVYAADVVKVRAFIAKTGHKWLQATQESIERVAIDIIHVNTYPTCILIDPAGKVVSREARGETLEKLLAQLLP